jgi:hypothetical protein
MRVERGLLLVLAAAATLGVVCALTGKDTGLFEVLTRGTSIPATPGSAPQAPRQAAQTSQAPVPAEVVVLAPRGGLVSPQTSAAPWSDHLPLALRLQRELARVGCYDGEINGIWTPATRRALKAFMDRVNAALPTEAPDRIQLLLVEAARERVCGAACPAGETLAEGRCIPNGVLAGRKLAPNALPTEARADQGPGSAAARPMPALAGNASRRGIATGDQGLTGPPQGGPDLSTPGQPPTATRAVEARRRRGKPSFFGFAIFKQFEKLGF